MALGFDTTHLREQWLPRLDSLLCNVSFARNRYRVHRVYLCAIVLSQDEATIGNLLEKMPSFSVTQDALDWQPDDDPSEGAVFQHLIRMSVSEDSPSLPLGGCLFENVESPAFAAAAEGDAESFSCQSFRLSSLEVYNADCCMAPGYHIGATAFQKLTELRDRNVPDELWNKWFFQYIVDLDESPQILWAREGMKSAVLWQVQLDIVDSSLPRYSSPGPQRSRRRRYAAFPQVYGADSSRDYGAPEAKRFRGVRRRTERKSWVAETRIKLKKNKVSFGDFKCPLQAARAVDAAYFYYGKENQVNFADTPQILSTYPLPVGKNDEEKLIFVKEKAKWLAHSAPMFSSSSPTSVTAEFKIPDTPSRVQTGVANLTFSSPIPSLSSESLMLISGRGDDGSAESSLQPLFNDDVAMPALDFDGEPFDQFLSGMESDPCDFMCMASSSHTHTSDLFQVNGFQDDVADHRLSEQ